VDWRDVRCLSKLFARYYPARPSRKKRKFLSRRLSWYRYVLYIFVASVNFQAKVNTAFIRVSSTGDVHAVSLYVILVWKWSARRTRNPAVRGLSPTLTTILICSSEFKSSSTLVSSQLVCLRQVRILNLRLFARPR